MNRVDDGQEESVDDTAHDRLTQGLTTHTADRHPSYHASKHCLTDRKKRRIFCLDSIHESCCAVDAFVLANDAS